MLKRWSAVQLESYGSRDENGALQRRALVGQGTNLGRTVFESFIKNDVDSHFVIHMPAARLRSTTRLNTPRGDKEARHLPATFLFITLGILFCLL